MNEPSPRVDWRRVVVYAVVMAFGIVLVWKAWERDFESRIAEAEAAEPPPSPPPVTDVSEWHSRRVVLAHREQMLDLLDIEDHPFNDHDRLLIDTCGRWAEAGDHRGDAIRLSYFDAWVLDARTVEMRPVGDGAVATWHRVELNPPPAPPGTKRTQGDAEPARAGLYRLASPVRREIAPAAWRQAVAVVSDPAFSRLPPGNARGLDGYTFAIESCIGGRYHLVNRWAPRSGEDAPFLAAVASLDRIAGAIRPESPKGTP